MLDPTMTAWLWCARILGMTALKVPANPVAERAVADVGAEPDLEDGDFDDMTDEERAELEAGIDRGIDDMRAGRLIDGDASFAKLRARR